MPVGGINGFQAARANLPAQARAVQEAWRRADAVCFDVDSTLIREEGLDRLAEHCGAGAKVKEWWVELSVCTYVWPDFHFDLCATYCSSFSCVRSLVRPVIVFIISHALHARYYCARDIRIVPLCSAQ